MALGDLLFPHVELKLIIVRSFKTDVEYARDISSPEYVAETALVHLNQTDMHRLSLKEGDNVSLKSPDGLVIVRTTVDDKTPEGCAVMPHGPWALALVAIPKDETPPTLHGIAITALRTKEKITSLEDLLFE
ncbi:MAG: molybdopterin dinucleotide binding domain-containing protein [Candidatus Thorarchaeota archaeon]